MGDRSLVSGTWRRDPCGIDTGTCAVLKTSQLSTQAPRYPPWHWDPVFPPSSSWRRRVTGSQQVLRTNANPRPHRHPPTLLLFFLPPGVLAVAPVASARFFFFLLLHHHRRPPLFPPPRPRAARRHRLPRRVYVLPGQLLFASAFEPRPPRVSRPPHAYNQPPAPRPTRDAPRFPPARPRCRPLQDDQPSSPQHCSPTCSRVRIYAPPSRCDVAAAFTVNLVSGGRLRISLADDLIWDSTGCAHSSNHGTTIPDASLGLRPIAEPRV